MTNESTRSERLSVGSRAEPLPLTNAAPASTLMRGSFRAGHSAAWSARLPWAQEVAGSNPAVPTISLRRRAATRTRRPVRPVTRARCPVRPATAAAANCRRSGAATWNRRPSSAAAGTGARRMTRPVGCRLPEPMLGGRYGPLHVGVRIRFLFCAPVAQPDRAPAF